MGVNLAVMRTFYERKRRGSLWRDLLPPAGGFLFCLFIWLSLPHLAKTIGAAWLVTGIVYLAVLTRGFRRPPARLDFAE
jgi:hypothetical protein